MILKLLSQRNCSTSRKLNCILSALLPSKNKEINFRFFFWKWQQSDIEKTHKKFSNLNSFASSAVVEFDVYILQLATDLQANNKFLPKYTQC